MGNGVADIGMLAGDRTVCYVATSVLADGKGLPS